MSGIHNKLLFGNKFNQRKSLDLVFDQLFFFFSPLHKP